MTPSQRSHGDCEDRPAPEVWVDCPDCCGEGEVLETVHVYEAGCGFSHPDVYGKTCPACGGARGMICEAEGNHVER